MIENLIFYFVVSFFTLIALGAVWEYRYRYTKFHISYVLGMPFLFLVLHQLDIDGFAVLDIREIFFYSGKAMEGSYGAGRGVGTIVAIIIMAIVGYLTSILCLIAQLIKIKTDGALPKKTRLDAIEKKISDYQNRINEK